MMVALNLLIYGVCLVSTIQASERLNIMGAINGQVLYRLGARQGVAILQGEWWRLVIPIFLHVNLMHIGFNTYVLWDCGTQVEDVYGSARTLFLYVATGVLSFVWSTMWNLFTGNPYGASVGASGALMGLVGLMLAIATRRGGVYMREIRAGLVRWIVIIFAMGLLMGGVDNAAHLGGLVAGYALGNLFEDREPQSAQERKRAYLLGTVALLTIVGSFAAMILHYVRTGS
jgi:rhomboid protease GluP